ncbi:MAG: hypothetical protein II333_04575 [Clostridia bacterium]|jgi:hypothetical protein|nr:hypothetical protein [Clostridia bacterium]
MENEKEPAERTAAQKQREVAYAMVRGQMPLEEVLTQFGVSEAEFTGWVMDGTFTEYAASLARGFAEADVAYVWKILQGLIRSGGVSAIRLYFELLGKKPPVHGAERLGTDAGANDLTGLRESIFSGEKGGG